jgi:hypothetical protein
MQLDLNPLPYRQAFELIDWCVEKGIDSEKCKLLLEVRRGRRSDRGIDWTIEIPEKYMTYFLIKWSSRSV